MNIPHGERYELCRAVHAEANAITKCAKYGSTTKNGTLYVTLSPCINCAKLIIQSDIKRVVYLEDYRDSTGLDLLRKW
jgi:dCMP deaminase